MVAPKTLSTYALRVLAEIYVTGVYVWVRESAVFLNDAQHTRVRYDTVEALLAGGYLVEDPEEYTLSVSDAGEALLERNRKAVGRGRAIDEGQQFMVQQTGRTLRRPNSKSNVRP